MSKAGLESIGWELGPAATVFKSRVTDVEARSARCLRTGQQDTFYKFLYPNWVNVIATTERLEIVLVKQFRFGSGKTELEIPGGVINRKESPVTAGCRELLEETGFSGSNACLIGQVCPNPALQDNICYTVLVENVERTGPQQQDDLEDIEVLTMKREDVFRLVAQGQIQHGLVLNALMFYHFRNSDSP